jgi:hypothetical protein
MRITVRVEDNYISIDGQYLSNIKTDLSWIPSGIISLEWYNDYGEIEYEDRKENTTEFEIFQQCVDVFYTELQRIEYERVTIKPVEVDYWRELRNRRNYILQMTDWTQCRDIFLENDEEWKVYRQELRDLPKNIEDPQPLMLDKNHPDWPTPPS